MELNNEEIIKELRSLASVYVMYSQATKLPYVVCDEESFNDQALFFSTEEEIKEYGKKALEDKILLMGMKYERKDFGRLYGTLFAIGVNSVVWHKGEVQAEVELHNLAKPADHSGLDPEKRPLMNPTLQLSGIYFMQEMRRPVTKEEHDAKNVRALEEELLVNLVKSSFYVPMIPDKEEPDNPKKLHFTYLKDKNEKILQPVFSDLMECQKFAQGKEYRMAKIPFIKLKDIMMKEAEFITFNPTGFNLVLTREQLVKLTPQPQKAN